MRKLLRLKEWVTLAEAARYLGLVLGEDVIEADVLRLALDGQLVLSVNFVNHVHARCGPVNSAENARYFKVPADWYESFSAEAGREAYQKGDRKLLSGVRLNTGDVIDLDEKVVQLIGVYDLPMIGGERLQVENMYQCLVGGPEVTTIAWDGAFVMAQGGAFCQLQAHFEDNPHYRVEQFKKPLEHAEMFYPGGSLPDDGVFVVRTKALAELFATIARDEVVPVEAKSLGTNERNTLLTIIGVLAKEAGIDLATPSKSAETIVNCAALAGISLSRTGVANHLRAIPGATEMRKK